MKSELDVSFARVEPWSGEPAGVYGYDDGATVWVPFTRGTLPRNFLGAPPVKSFDDLVPAPTPFIPSGKCNSLSCL